MHPKLSLTNICSGSYGQAKWLPEKSFMFRQNKQLAIWPQ